ncbi:MAG: bifunctional proline dehydrogenase/L-glutamate gamma-semialdehyde dehydrogenase PutA, partial [Gammaproteobacteria bacterium]
MSQDSTFDFLVPSLPERSEARTAISAALAAHEGPLVDRLLERLNLDEAARRRVLERSWDLVRRVREVKRRQGVLEAFQQEYDLSSEEGVVLMCLAEALLRIPDDETAEKLIAEKLEAADWEAHLGRSSSLFVNASTWGLMLTGRLVTVSRSARRDIRTTLGKLVNRSGEPVVRAAIRQAMRIMGHQYVMGRTIGEAMDRAGRRNGSRYRYCFDMLGEAALTAKDADRYLRAYREGFEAIGRKRGGEDIFAAPSLSVKLSALHPRYEYEQRGRVLSELVPRVLDLARMARERDLALTLDAEEVDRQLLGIDVFREVLAHPDLAGRDGFGIVVQTYLRTGPDVIEYLAELAAQTGHRIPLRLVKGAYWDAEIKNAQVEGYDEYPVFTRKCNTDLSYIACAQRALELRQAFYPQFATHNAHTIAIVTELAGDRLDYEFQRLHGMGEDLYGAVMESEGYNPACRVYAPVGSHEDLLPYLVRRLLENGSNTSFVNRISDERLPVEEVADDPVEKARISVPRSHPAIPLPADLYGEERRNSAGVDLASETELEALARKMQAFAGTRWSAAPLLAEDAGDAGDPRPITSPADPARVVGEVRDATAAQVDAAIAAARRFAPAWDAAPVEERAACLERAADLMQERLPEFLVLCAREAGKTVHDSIAEVREAIDFLRYYAVMSRRLFSEPMELPGPTGESNRLALHGRGVFACISPWNFPLAIFTGQVSAALAAGNTVLAKPAEQTPLIAARAVALLHEAGVPREALQLLPGDGAVVGARLSNHPGVDGVAFTGSTETARLIAQSLVARDAPLAALVAETGGQNAMLVDSSALPEQVVKDAIGSALLSAGQRCSALRVLYLQQDVADRMIEMLTGAMHELRVGAPEWLSTDIGPVIDADALAVLQAHAERMDREAHLLARTPLPEGLAGHFFAPCAYEIEGIGVLEREVFGPVLHVARYRARDLDRVIDDINGTRYGLTLGIHSRIESVQRHIAQRVRVGNCYVNRSMTGAVVGVQPFGGEGLS